MITVTLDVITHGSAANTWQCSTLLSWPPPQQGPSRGIEHCTWLQGWGDFGRFTPGLAQDTLPGPGLNSFALLLRLHTYPCCLFVFIAHNPQPPASAPGVPVPRRRLPAPCFPWHPLTVGTKLLTRLSPAGALLPNRPLLLLCGSGGRSAGIPLPCALRSGTQDEVNTEAALAALHSPGTGMAKDWEHKSKALQAEM